MKRPKNFVKILSTVRNSTWHITRHQSDHDQTGQVLLSTCVPNTPPLPSVYFWTSQASVKNLFPETLAARDY